MAKGANDVILRDRLQFDIDVNGNTSLVYGRIDLSDYVSIPQNKGLAIKEVRFQLRQPSMGLGNWPSVMLEPHVAATFFSSLKIFATTTAYENVSDVGIASPNVLCVMEKETTVYVPDPAAPSVVPSLWCDDRWYGTPDLHPEGYDVVTDLLIGISLSNCDLDALADSTAELDIMLIAEPKKITQKDMTQMLTQAQDL
tara:strand:- start:313 stop:906 length:594 start_codon:yes stop_codon:yes gene_type:complete